MTTSSKSDGQLERTLRAEGRRIVANLIQQYRGIPGITGVHMMGHQAEAESAEIIAASGILDMR